MVKMDVADEVDALADVVVVEMVEAATEEAEVAIEVVDKAETVIATETDALPKTTLVETAHL